ncbi:DUF87 domain-containing protein [Kaistia dalseonensis]|uniref:Energy-coupling factor transporter ATP-binding protein EcfA2 n=1 Tax=Kaistia dalseonensis TaxID=410840 RepID=A0ABU0HE02_9HYPH|nr:DUF87 domain-containing protein [Kaistia dalseonensis]MCX5497876.1 DUF87 domain-containing protein [Kaistia dalseonensis]MDQ0440520.1 energy-coupling factor transporter ATP-binding protein EcfA2 [Kaistia dalseonensis]
MSDETNGTRALGANALVARKTAGTLAPLISSGAAGYAMAAQSALGFSEDGRAFLELGSMTPWLSEAAISAIGERRRAALGEISRRSGLSPPMPLLYAGYLRAVRENEKILRSYDAQSAGRTGFVANDSNELAYFLTRIFDPARHSADAKGYASYLCDIDPQLGNIITAEIAVRLPAEERLRHTYIVGASGSGKSELLKLLVHHEVTHGEAAVVVVDAHSDLCEQIARWPELADGERLVFIKPGEFAGLVATINPLEPPPGASDRVKEKIANRLAEVLAEICRGEGGASMTPRMVNIGKAAVRLLLDKPGATLWDLLELLAEETPKPLLEAGQRHPDRAVSWFFKNDWQASDYRAAKGGMRARLLNLLMLRDFSDMTCGPSTVQLAPMVDAGKVLLFSLGSAGTDAAQVLGQLIVGLLAAVGDLRKAEERTDRRPVHVVLDECHNFTGPATETILTELRKYGLHLTLAHQFLTQLGTDERDAVLANTAVKILGRSDYAPRMLAAMGLDDDEGRTLARNLQPRQFLVRWGARSPFMLIPRSDLADDTHRISEDEWKAVRSRQEAFYRSVEAKPVTVMENASVDAARGFSRALD